MKRSRRAFLQFSGVAVASPAFLRFASAQAYPVRPVTVIVPFPAGGATDVIARVVAERMQGTLGQRLLIENVGGADGSIGEGRVARAQPDGYTICLSLADAHVFNGGFYSLPYDLLNDFAPISLLATVPVVLVARKTMPAKDLAQLIAWLMANPDRASAGMNTIGFRLMAVLFQKRTGRNSPSFPIERPVICWLMRLLAGLTSCSEL
jgi:tripartite-type tricarboxylate transporter receptor subunit TctC